MDIDARTMAKLTMASWGECVHSDKPVDDSQFLDLTLYPDDGNLTEFFNISSDDLYRCIEQDSCDFALLRDSPSKDNTWDLNANTEIEELLLQRSIRSDSDESQVGIFYGEKAVPSYDNFFNLPEALKTCINPRTLQPSLFLHTVPEEEIKPYHPTQDHDYMKVDSEDSDAVEVKEEIDEGEPVVDVWKIENFSDEQLSLPRPVPEQLPTYRQILRDRTRRTSKRAAENKRREQARKISHAVHAVLNIKKPVTGRQYKNKLKNSVETTPSQSDIEEWQSQAVRPMYTKITKKKTSKGRIDHSQSERNRREVLRKKFSDLRKRIPIEFLRGEKASAQISKQKILNGAKSYIAEIYKCESSYRTMQQQNRLLQELWLKRHTSKLPKPLKKHK